MTPTLYKILIKKDLGVISSRLDMPVSHTAFQVKYFRNLSTSEKIFSNDDVHLDLLSCQ